MACTVHSKIRGANLSASVRAASLSSLEGGFSGSCGGTPAWISNELSCSRFQKRASANYSWSLLPSSSPPLPSRWCRSKNLTIPGFTLSRGGVILFLFNPSSSHAGTILFYLTTPPGFCFSCHSQLRSGSSLKRSTSACKTGTTTICRHREGCDGSAIP